MGIEGIEEKTEVEGLLPDINGISVVVIERDDNPIVRYPDCVGDKEVELCYYDNNYSEFKIALMLENSNVNHYGRNLTEANTIISIDNYNNLQKAVRKYFEGERIRNIEDLPNKTSRVNLSFRQPDCIVCGEEIPKENEDKVFSVSTEKESNRNNLGIKHYLSIHCNCVEKFCSIDIDTSKVVAKTL